MCEPFLRRRQPTLTDRVGRVCEPTVPCVQKIPRTTPVVNGDHDKTNDFSLKKDRAVLVLYPALTSLLY